MDELEEMLRKLDKVPKGTSWNKLRGDATERIVAHYLQKYLRGFKVVQDAWIEGYTTEFDLLIVNEDAQPIEFTNAYPKDKVRLIIEVKTSGTHTSYGGVRNIAQHIVKLRETAGKPMLYFSFWDNRKKREILAEILGEDTIFSMKETRREVRSGEWRRFVEKVCSILAE